MDPVNIVILVFAAFLVCTIIITVITQITTRPYPQKRTVCALIYLNQAVSFIILIIFWSHANLDIPAKGIWWLTLLLTACLYSRVYLTYEIAKLYMRHAPKTTPLTVMLTIAGIIDGCLCCLLIFICLIVSYFGLLFVMQSIKTNPDIEKFLTTS